MQLMSPPCRSDSGVSTRKVVVRTDGGLPRVCSLSVGIWETDETMGGLQRATHGVGKLIWWSDPLRRTGFLNQLEHHSNMLFL